MRVAFDTADPVLSAAAWSRVAEPGDTTAGMLVRAVGATTALDWVLAAIGPGAERPAVDGLLERLDVPTARRSVLGRRLLSALARWAPRFDGLDPRRELRVLASLDGRLLVPGQPGWLRGADLLGDAAPFCLWVREGRGAAADWDAVLGRSVALVGARASTDYGTRVASDLAAGLADRRFAVVSGGAYGIDAAAHRGTIAAGGATVAVMAGGVDRLYPAGNRDLLERILAEGGAVMSEVPPGSMPSRTRFLQRNRVIAAIAGATVVVEAAWRSGSLSTATHAARLNRPVGAVPGPITSMASAGCHRLMRENAAVCVTDADEVAELAGTIGGDIAPEKLAPSRPTDGLGDRARHVYDALPVRASAGIEALARACGAGPRDVLAGLGELEARGLASRTATGWRRAGTTT